ncbi:MAG: hypothetical protein ACKO0W_11275, partial [Planctomycetota bacterium]
MIATIRNGSSRVLIGRTAIAFVVAFAGVVGLDASTADAAETVIYASSIPNPGGAWRDWSEATGAPGCGACECSSITQQYAYNGNPTQGFNGDSVPLRVTNFTDFVLPAGNLITGVNIDAMMRYDSGTSGTVRSRRFVNGAQYGADDQVSFTSDDVNCRYRFGADGDLPTPAGGWTQALVNSIQVEFWRVSTSTSNPLRITAVKLVVTFEPDSDNDGFVDSQDCAPNNPAINPN